MRIIGIDFTSDPKRKKPLTCLNCQFGNGILRAGELVEWSSYNGFEEFLSSKGGWVAGIDFPFGQARRLIENIGWPRIWEEYVELVGRLDREEFKCILNEYKELRAYRDKEHLRRTDIAASAVSPQKTVFVPVAQMFFEGAPRLVRAGVTVPGLIDGDPERIVVEAYPGVLAKRLVNRQSYKQDDPRRQTIKHFETRREIFHKIKSPNFAREFGFSIEAPVSLCDNPSGDHLDALLCAAQAAWAALNRDHAYGVPRELDPLEGWIADPIVCAKMNHETIELNRR